MAAEHQTGIYEIRNTDSGKRYVGSAMDFAKRWREHINALQRNAHHCLPLQRAWCLYGPGAFHFNKLIACSKDNLIMYEQAAMDALAPEYNVAPRAGSQLGYRHSEASRRRMSEARPKDFSPMKGKSHSAATRAKISAARKGKGGGPRSAERLKKIGDAHRGRPKAEEHKAKISATLTGTSTGRGSLSPEQVREVRRLGGLGLGRIRVAKALGITPSAANAVLGGHAYLWVI